MTEQKKTLIRTSLDQEQQLNNRLGIAKAETVVATYQESLQFPSLNVRGLKAAWTGEQVRTIIPSTAIAEMDLRLVPDTPAERQISLIKSFIESKGFYIVEKDPTQEERLQHPKLIKVESRIGSRAFQTALDSKLALWLEKVMTEVFGENNFFRMQTTGGSQPIAPFITELNLPALSVRIPNPDNNIHAPNENLRLGNFKEGIKMCLGILSHPYE
jgi:acetylornithine deacetylase/succinyl-diaminopimelate desuccinylase-like protein